MTLTLEVTEQQMEQYRKQAEARGLSLEQWLVQTADSHVPKAEDEPESFVHLQRTNPEEWIRRFQEWVDSHDPNTPVLSDYAMSRDSIYD
ncbi:hypothetical protein F183_A08870 [Bryobacterales bacterium F-183]|nr:hypothetical protein F183_A08870 [Bryobacterales bacterium F-183]